MTRLPSFLALTLVVFSGPVLADASLLEQIQYELQDELYPIEKIVIGYERPSVRVPKLAVGEFRINDDELREWSQAIAEILRWRIQYVPNTRLLMPSAYLTTSDAGADTGIGRPLLTSRENFQGLNQSLGIESVLTGRLLSEGADYVLDVELVDSVSGKKISEKSWNFSVSELPGVLIEISAWVYTELGMELSQTERAFLGDPGSLRSEAIVAFVDNYKDLQSEDRLQVQDLVADLRKQFPEFAVFALYALRSKSYAMNLDEVYKNLEFADQLRKEFPTHAGVTLEAYRTMDIGAMPKHEVASRLVGLRDLAAKNPNDPMIMINVAVALGDNGSSLEALTVLLEAASRWPDHYRVWWSLGWSLNAHAWQLRGDRMWREVPEQVKGRFKLLAYLSDQAVDKALSLHARNADLWIMKLSSLGSNGGYSEELMEVFDLAVDVAPSNETIYGNALNFAENKWGGNADARRKIIRLAEENNPQAAWPKIMRSQHAADFEDIAEIKDSLADEFSIERIMEHPDFWKYAFGILAAFFAYSYFSRRGPKEPPEDPFRDFNSR